MDELIQLARVISNSKPHRTKVRAARWEGEWEWRCSCGAKSNRYFTTNAATGKDAARHERRGK
ncbi:hypothetical protein [Streptomyces coffeae]|uniref:Uncharacterized protein n=1 Tax=Streptomyces coffeae TaxID=621382 RepID=A0ABS1NAM6_9ACTN|nr:hypothetical protein [Streptomyces coffeae]MBL1096881.1 hypothetical protein [Streptomyces coffeae]